MKHLTAIFIGIALSFVLVLADEADEHAFESLARQHGREYSSDEVRALRLQVFRDNIKRAASRSMKDPSAQFRPAGPFFDATREEFEAHLESDPRIRRAADSSSRRATSSRMPQATRSPTDTATPRDWRDLGAVSKVGMQGIGCASGWAFALAGMLEATWTLNGNLFEPVSVQQLVSCDSTGFGCHGGALAEALNWFTTSQVPVATARSYPYASGDGVVPPCHSNKSSPGLAPLWSHALLPRNESLIAEYVSELGPVAVKVDAASWQFYSGGVLTVCESSSLNHGVLIVGFYAKGDSSYWIVKNSWGSTWGEDGYIRLAKGEDLCQISSVPVVATFSPAPPPSPFPLRYFTRAEKCTKGCLFCEYEEFPLDTCIANGTGAVLYRCAAAGLLVLEFADDRCTSRKGLHVHPVGQCFAHGGQNIMNYCTHRTTAPATQAPASPSPNAPTRVPPSRHPIMWKTCTFSTCDRGCKERLEEPNTCLTFSLSVSSYKLECNKDGKAVVVREYQGTSSCTGTPVMTHIPTNQCVVDIFETGYADFTCAV